MLFNIKLKKSNEQKLQSRYCNLEFFCCSCSFSLVVLPCSFTLSGKSLHEMYVGIANHMESMFLTFVCCRWKFKFGKNCSTCQLLCWLQQGSFVNVAIKFLGVITDFSVFWGVFKFCRIPVKMKKTKAKLKKLSWRNLRRRKTKERRWAYLALLVFFFLKHGFFSSLMGC